MEVKLIQHRRKSIVIEAPPGTGKSVVAKYYKNVLDLDPMKFKWIIGKTTRYDFELLKGAHQIGRKMNSNWPKNYYDEILSQLFHYDIVLIGFWLHIRKNKHEFEYFLKNNNIDYRIAIPSDDNVELILERLKIRGANDEFLNWLQIHYSSHFIDEFNKSGYPKIIVRYGEYLEDALIRERLLHKRTI